MAITHNLYIDQGTTFSVILNIYESDGTLKNLSDYTVKSQMRKSFASQSNVTFTANVTNAANGEITLSLSAGESANIKAGRYYYDVETTAGGVVSRLIEGIAVVNPEVTK